MALTSLQLALLQSVKQAEISGPKVYELSIPSFMNGAPIKLRALTSNEFFRITKQCTHDGVYNPIEFRMECITAAVIDPDLNDAEFRDALHCPTASAIVCKVFNIPGVVDILYRKIEDISAFNEDDVTFRECADVDG